MVKCFKFTYNFCHLALNLKKMQWSDLMLGVYLPDFEEYTETDAPSESKEH